MIITDRDRCRLGYFLTCESMAGVGNVNARSDLETKIEEARAIPAEGAPADLVTMNATVVLVDLDSGEQKQRTLVYPEDQDLVPQGISVLQPLGRCILGRSVGEVVELPGRGSTTRFLIKSLLYQPEAAGDIQL